MRLLPLETLDDAAAILNELREARDLPGRWSARRFIASAINGDINLTILLPHLFMVDRKDGGERYRDTPARPCAPKGAAHFFVDKPELLELSLHGTAELSCIVNITNDGVRSVLHSVRPYMTISLSDLWINSEQLFRYVLAEQPPIQTSPAKRRKLRTNSLDALIQTAVNMAGSVQTGAVFVQLRDLALQEKSPFNGQLEDGAPCYTNDKGIVATLTKQSLAKRLKNFTL